MSAANFETLRARAALMGLSLLRSDGPTPVYCLGALGDDSPIWAHTEGAIEAALGRLEARQRAAATTN